MKMAALIICAIVATFGVSQAAWVGGDPPQNIPACCCDGTSDYGAHDGVSSAARTRYLYECERNRHRYAYDRPGDYRCPQDDSRMKFVRRLD